MFPFLVLMFFFFLLFFVHFSKKLIILLVLEGLMLCLVSLSQAMWIYNFSSYFILILLSAFMVLDSVFGISLLVSSSRSSSKSEKILF